MQRQPVVSQKDSDDNDNNASPNSQLRFGKTGQIPQFVRSSEALNLKFSAVIRSGYFKQFQTLSIFYTVVNGPNWNKTSGQISGISQVSSSPDGQIVWNFPIQVVYEASNLMDPPQVVFVLYGSDFFGRTIPKAYGNVHFPLSQGTFKRKVRTFKVMQHSIFTRMYQLVTGSYHEFKQIQKVLNNSEQRSNLKTQTSGVINIQFQTKRYNFEKHGYND